MGLCAASQQGSPHRSAAQEGHSEAGAMTGTHPPLPPAPVSIPHINQIYIKASQPFIIIIVVIIILFVDIVNLYINQVFQTHKYKLCYKWFKGKKNLIYVFLVYFSFFFVFTVWRELCPNVTWWQGSRTVMYSTQAVII